MSHFKAKIPQIRSLMELRPRSRWRSLQRSPRPLAGFKGAYFKERGGKGKGREKEGEEGKEGGEEEGEGKWGRKRKVKGGTTSSS